MLDKTLLARLLEEQGTPADAAVLERLDVYARLLVEWNEKMNLTAITDPYGVTVKHMADSLQILPLLPTGTFSLIDVGTGAGFPGVPVAVCRPDCRVTLLDGLNKRLVFLEAVCKELGLDTVRVHARAEEAARQSVHREVYDIATARAVARLPVLCEYCLPFVRVGGRFIAMKGPDGDAELAEAAAAVKLLGGKAGAPVRRSLPTPDGAADTRVLLPIEKVAHTPEKYPRHGGKIAKAPL